MMRTVQGRTDRVVVVGAGLSGLSAAMQLAGRGCHVTVVERGDHPGGRVGRADIGGYRLDTGPTVLTMPDIIDDAFAALGEKLTDRVELLPVHPAYNAVFADGETLQVHTEPTAMFAEIERFSGRREADAYLEMRAWLTKLYDTEFDGFIGANFDSPLSLLTPQLVRLLAMGGFRRWENVIQSVPERRAAASGVHLPGALRGRAATERPGRLCGDRLHGHHRRCHLSPRWHARPPRRHGRSGS